jgi:hypothetical protein
MIWQGVNKRRFPRADYPCRVVVLRSDLNETFSTHTENIGMGGICTVLPKELPRFCPVRTIIYIKDGGSPIECNARIVWTVPSKGDFDTGVEFIDIKEPDRLRIESIIEQCLGREV